MKIIKASISHVKEIKQLIDPYAKKDVMLPKSYGELYENVREFYVSVDDKENKKVIGCCALHIFWEDLAEIKSLAVDEKQQGKGLGKKLVKECMKEAKKLGIKKVFTLTKIPKFFEKLGFKIAEKNSLPQKVWMECYKCSKFPDCDETALIYTIK